MTAGPQGEPVAVIGLGRMGAPIATRLAAGGFDVSGYDLNAEAGAGVLDSSIRRAPSAAVALDGAQLVLTVLPGSPELHTLMADDGLLDLMPRDTVWVDCTSTAPDVASDLRTAARRRNVPVVDCGLGGGPDEAAAGTLTVYVGGDADVVNRCRRALECFAARGRIYHVGDSGAGTLAKLLVNLVWCGHATIVTEALLLARSAGLDPRRLADLLPRTPAGSRFATEYVPAVLDGDYLPSFGLDRLVEELDALVRLAGSTGTPFATSTAVARIHRDALDRFGPADGELLGVAHLEHLSGGLLRAEHG